MSVRLRDVRIKLVEDIVLADLQTAVNSWLTERGEETLLDLQLRSDATDSFQVLIVYTEE